MFMINKEHISINYEANIGPADNTTPFMVKHNEQNILHRKSTVDMLYLTIIFMRFAFPKI